MIKNKIPFAFMLLYLGINALAFLFFSFGGESSYPSLRDGEENVISLLIVFLSQSLFIILTYFAVYKIKFKKIKALVCYGFEGRNFFGFLLIFLTMTNFIVIFTSSVTAGSSDEAVSGGWFGFFCAVLQPSSLVMIYLFFYKINRVWLALFIVFGFTNLLVGWTNFIIYYLLLFAFHAHENGYSLRKMSIFAFISFLTYPVVYFSRIYFRMRGANNLGATDLDVIAIVAKSGSYVDFLMFSYWHLIERIQQFYLSLSVFLYKNEIATAFTEGLVLPFYAEGLHRSFITNYFWLFSRICG